MRDRFAKATLALAGVVMVAMLALSGPHLVKAQNTQQAGSVPVQATESLYYTIPISATTAVGNPTTLTLTAPAAGLFNYVCYLAINSSNNNTGAVNTNVTASSTNFNSWAMKWSKISAASNNYDWSMQLGTPATGCAKSTLAATATTFVSPTSTDEAYTWYATYFVAP